MKIESSTTSNSSTPVTGFMTKLVKSIALVMCVVPNTYGITAVNAVIDPPQGLSSEIDLALQGKSGNTDTKDHAVSFASQYREGQHIYLLLTDYSWGESLGERDEENGSVHVRSIWLDALRSNWDTEVFAQWGFDQFKDLSDRSLVGAGIRYHVDKDTAKGAINGILGIGSFFEDEKRKQTSESADTTRLNVYANWEYDRAKSRYPSVLFLSFYLQPSLEEIEDVRSIASAGIEVPVSDNLSLKLSVDVDYDSQPFGNIDKTDTHYETAVSYQF